MNAKPANSVLSEKEIQERLGQGMRISKEEFIKKFKSSKATITK